MFLTLSGLVTGATAAFAVSVLGWGLIAGLPILLIGASLWLFVPAALTSPHLKQIKDPARREGQFWRHCLLYAILNACSCAVGAAAVIACLIPRFLSQLGNI